MIRLEVLDGQDAGRRIETEADLVRIGRGEGNDLTLNEWHVSSDHASIAFVGEGHVLRDRDSTNGTRIKRGEALHDLRSAGDGERALQDGDVLLLGDPEQPVSIAVSILEDDTEAAVVAMRRHDEVPRVEAAIDAALLRALYAAQKDMAAAVDVDRVLEMVAQHVFALLSLATHVTVALREGDSAKPGAYVPVGTQVRGSRDPSEPVPITRSVFKKVVAERAAVLAADARKDVGETASIMGAQIHSTIGVPLWKGDDILGVLQVDNRSSSAVFRERDLDVLAVLAQTCGQAFEQARLVQRLRLAEERQRKENHFLKEREHNRYRGMIGDSAPMRSLMDQLTRVVNTRVTVLVQGETGTGKELVASAVHYSSRRAERLFVAQNCAALPENLLESELFGHKKGAFTGATDEKKGLFELADGGTLFLDEVTEMPMALQAKLLRALQEGEVRPLGSDRVRRVDVRIVAATNRDLEKEVSEGRFREDLFYRLSVFPLRVPPLRERRDDIPLLAGHFLEKYGAELGRGQVGFSQKAMEGLQAYEWPGNVRELENEVQRLVIQLDEGEEFVHPQHLSPRVRESEQALAGFEPTKGTLKQMVEQVERRLLSAALAEHKNNKSATAKTLGITREGLHKKLKGYGMA